MKKLSQKEVGKRIVKMRTDIGYTQNSFAHLIGITPQHLCHIESGKQKLSDYIAKQIATVLNLDVNYVLGLTNYPTIDTYQDFIESKAEKEDMGLLLLIESQGFTIAEINENIIEVSDEDGNNYCFDIKNITHLTAAFKGLFTSYLTSKDE